MNNVTFDPGEKVDQFIADQRTKNITRDLCNSHLLILDNGWRLKSEQPIVVLSAYVIPLLVTFTLIANIMVCIVLLRSTRNSTNLLLVAMAVSDTLTGMCFFPVYVYFYTLGYYTEWVPYSWCLVYFFLVDYLPTSTHNMSLWL